MKNLTIEEKINMIHGVSFFETGGVPRLSIPPLVMSDGPMGVRHELKKEVWEPAFETEDYVTYFPSNVALAATWNTELAYEAGKSLGAEARGRGKDVILAPGINVMRTPLCGRNFEYMSEDPCLISGIAVAFIRGIQENDVAACVKHFALNNQEVQRAQVNVEVEERALREIYLQAFEACVKAGVYTLMSAYNRVRGEYCSHSKQLLDEILKKEWGFDGVVISDWAAVHDTEKAAACGLDIEMSTEPDFDHYFLAAPLKKALEEGRVSIEDVDKKTERILKLIERIKIGKQDRCEGSYNDPLHRERALAAARESVVLLKNEGVLPIEKKPGLTIGVIGENAQKLHAFGGGSAEIKALYEISPILGLKMAAGGNIKIEYSRGYSPDTALAGTLREEAVNLAGRCDVVIMIGGLNHDYDSEGLDKKDLALPYGQDELILSLLEVKPDTIVTILSGSPVEMKRFAQKAKAIVQCWYAGCEGGRGLAEVLFGLVNPSGKLPVTFPMELADSPAHALHAYPGEDTVTYKEGIYVGYRYFDQQEKQPLFCFGHGLSYTEFTYGGLETEMMNPKADKDESRSDKEEAEKKQDINDNNCIAVKVRCRIRNTGKREGKETVQLYLSKTGGSVEMPPKELKAFEKVHLNPGEEKEVELVLNERDFSYYDTEQGAFRRYDGSFTIMVGTSSREIRLIKELGKL